MTTASLMIVRALCMTGEKQPGAVLTPAEKIAHLETLNSMLESWSLERLLCYQVLQESFALTGGTYAYTIGVGGAFNTARPNKILEAFVRDGSGYNYPVSLITPEIWNTLQVNLIANTYPSCLYYESAFTGGLATINLYPKPDAGLTLFIDSLKQIQQFPSVDTVVVLPPGYQRAIESNLCIELAAGQIGVSNEAIRIAREAKAAIRKINMPALIMQPEFGGGGRSSIFTG